MSLSAPDQIINTLKKRGALRTSDLALVFHMTEEQIDAALAPSCAPGGLLISCVVELGDGRKVKEYRPSIAAGGALRDDSYKPGRPRGSGKPGRESGGFGSSSENTRALAARFTTPPAAPAAPAKSEKPVKQQPRKEVASTMSIAERILSVIGKRGPMTAGQLRSLIDNDHVPTICSQLAKAKKLIRLDGDKRGGSYGLPGRKAPAKAEAAKPRMARLIPEKRIAAIAAMRHAQGAGDFRPAIAADGALLLMGQATPGELSPVEARVLAEFLRRIDRTGMRA